MVAFSVSRGSSLDVIVDTPISFDIIHTNVGGGWQESNEYQFIIPVTGLYFFSNHARADVATSTGDTYGTSQLVVNGSNKMRTGGVDKYGGLSFSTIQQLSEGDEVYMAQEADRAIIDDIHFSGFLLYAII